MLSVAIAYPDGPDDVRELAHWLKQLPKGKVSQIFVLGKTEGPATLNDFSRNLALAATDAAIAAFDQDLLQPTLRLFSTGCEGLASPITLMMAAIARLMLLVGTPIMIGLLTWFASGFVAMQQLVAVQAAEQAWLVSEVRELQDYRRDAFARGAALTKDVGTIKEMLVRLQDSFDKRR